MKRPHTIIIVGGENNNQASLETQLEATHLHENIGIAISSIYHGEVFNINESNNMIEFHTPVLTAEEYTKYKRIDKTNEDLQNQKLWEYPQQVNIITIPTGYYPSVISILEIISYAFQKLNLITNETIEPPEFVSTILPNGYIECYAKRMRVVINNVNSPWSMLKIDGSDFNYMKIRKMVKNHEFGKDLKPAFLYASIVEDSYINGKLSRILAILPIRMKSEWSYHEFAYLNFVPINVKEFSKIFLQIKDIDGEFVQFNPDYKTIITLQTKTYK